MIMNVEAYSLLELTICTSAKVSFVCVGARKIFARVGPDISAKAERLDCQSLLLWRGSCSAST
jgi:hypothetical protein